MAYSSYTKEELDEAIEQGRDLGKVQPKKAGVPATAWQPGQSGNPEGRPKGAVGKATLVKQAILAESENILLENAPKVVQAVVDQAIKGCRASQKLVWGSLIPSKKATETEEKKGGFTFKVVVEGMNVKEVRTEDDDITDADYEEIKDGD